MNKNCIILEIRKRTEYNALATPTGSPCVRTETGEIEVWPDISDYDGPCVLYTPEEAAIEVERRSYSPTCRYQIVVIGEAAP